MPSSADMSGRSFLGAFGMSAEPVGQLSIVEARTLGDYLFLRRLRNQVRNLMTNDTRPISLWRQLRFFLLMRCRPNKESLRIFIARYGSQHVGYLLVRSSGMGMLITEVIDQNFRRQGIGKKLVAFAQSRYREIVAEIREDNHASIALHVAMGFSFERQSGGIAVYRFRK